MKLSQVRVPRSLTLLAVPLVGATLLVGGVVAASVLSAPTIHVTVEGRIAETTIPITVVDPKAAAPDDVPGFIRETTVEVGGMAPATGIATVANVARGTVRIESHWSEVQPLAATTRLLSEGGVLFRTTRRVDVPPGGVAEVEVTADQPGESGNIGPGRFTIVALWPGLQEKIFGTSTVGTAGGGGTAAAVAEPDLAKAEGAARAKALDSAAAELAKDAPSGTAFDRNSLSIASVRTLSRSEAGAVAPEASVRLRATVRALITNPDRLQAAITAAVRREFPGESPTTTSLTPNLGDAPLPGGPFPVTVALSLTPDRGALSAERVAGKTRDTAVSQLGRTPGVTAVRITGLPFWSKRLPPASRIRIVLTNAST